MTNEIDMIPNIPIIFFGSSKLVLPIIQTLKDHFELQLVVTTEQKETDAVPAYCLENAIPYQSVTTLHDKNLQSFIINLKSPLAVLADFGLIVPDEVLNAFPKGIINIHPSLLPKFRGPTPVQSAILAGETETGVSIIRLDNEVDHGPLLAQEKEPISDEDTAETLHEKLFTKGAKLLVKVLPDYISGNLVPKPQDDTRATFTEKLNRNSGYIDPEKLRITNYELRITKMIRAYFPWPGVWTTIRIKNKEVRIKILPGNKLQVEGKKPMSYKDFLNGYPNAKEILPILQMSNTTNKE